MCLLRKELETEMEEEELDKLIETLFAIFYVDDAYICRGTPSSYRKRLTASSLLSNLLAWRPTPRRRRQ